MAKLGRPYSTRPKETMVRVNFYIDPDQADYLDEIAKNTDISKGDIIRQALEQWIKNNPADEFIQTHKLINKTK